MYVDENNLYISIICHVITWDESSSLKQAEVYLWEPAWSTATEIQGASKLIRSLLNHSPNTSVKYTKF